ncbi:MAG: tetratricopeptide repeat protein [Actinomycetota bacterium]
MPNEHGLSLAEAFSQAMAAWEAGKAGEARRLARLIVEQRPTFGGAHYLLGLMALDQGHARRASEHLAEAVALDPDQPAPRLAMGRAQEVLGNLKTAILHYRAIVGADPDHVEANARLAELLRRTGRADDALAHCRRAVAANPRHAEALNTLGALLHERGDNAEAAGALRHALEIRPDWPAALNNYGTVLRALGRPAEAIPFLEGAVDMRRQHAPTRANLAGALRELGRLDEAVRQAERAVKHDGRSAPAWLELGLARQAKGFLDGAAAAFDRAVSADPTATGAHWLLAEARRGLGQTERAAFHYRKCMQLDPADRVGAALGLALCGAAPAPDKAPEAYVRQLFDDYADKFDSALVERLDYRAPDLLADALARVLGPAEGLAVLDAGCGTGLMGPVLKPRARRLDGVDLSPAMVAKAGARGLYDEVRVAELVGDLVAHPGTYDLVVAADVLVYVGDLAPVMAAAAAALVAGGCFAFTVERDDLADGFRLGPKSRYAHAPHYVRARAEAAGFELAVVEPAATRREAGVEVPGLVVVARRR